MLHIQSSTSDDGKPCKNKQGGNKEGKIDDFSNSSTSTDARCEDT